MQGSQTAFVTAEPSALDAIVNVGDLVGCVRLKFHWDHDTERLAKESSSCWVRVSQMFAGGGQGAVGHPRVGVEVIVEFLDGDPDRPIVTGRVYNGANLPPAISEGSATATTFKTYSVPGGAQYNEIRLEDSAHNEKLTIHAGKDLVHHVEHDSDETVRNDSRSTVNGFRWEETQLDRFSLVRRDNYERVGGIERHTVDLNQTISVRINQTTAVGADQGQFIGGSQKTTITEGQIIKIGFPTGAGNGDGDSTLTGQTIEIKGGPQITTIHEGQTFTIRSGGRTSTIHGDDGLDIEGYYSLTASKDVKATATQVMTLRGAHQWIGALSPDGTYGLQSLLSKDFAITGQDTGTVAATNELTLKTTGGGGKVTVEGDLISATGKDMVLNGADSVKILSKAVYLVGGTANATIVGTIGLQSITGDITVGTMGGVVSITGSIIKLN